MGHLLFSLAVLQFLNSVGSNHGLNLQLWYLDDGSFVGPQPLVGKFMQSIVSTSPNFGLHLNLEKRKIFCPSGNQSFPELLGEIRHLSEKIHLLGSPVYSSDQIFKSAVASKSTKCWILSLSLLMCTVVFGLADTEFSLLDKALRHSFGTNYSAFNSRFILVTSYFAYSLCWTWSLRSSCLLCRSLCCNQSLLCQANL